uniref:Uncharacterized protein n=1 Tax=Pygocentrus nattereri TaxID=42514 RepID=A0A3B4CF50_PYGNA
MRQLFGIEAPVNLVQTGWRKHFNSYTLQGRRNVIQQEGAFHASSKKTSVMVMYVCI